jgi:hypothetical protein
MLPLRTPIAVSLPSWPADFDSPPVFKRHRVKVSSVRDLNKQPLTIREYLELRHHHIGRWLCRGIDNKGNRVLFFADKTQENWSNQPLRFCLFDPSTGSPVEIMPTRYGHTKRDRWILQKVLQELLSLKFNGDMFVGVYCQELEAAI